MSKIKKFVDSIGNFFDFNLSLQIDCFCYYLIVIAKFDGLKPLFIQNCFDNLNIPSHSNISQYLKINTKNKKNKKFFIKKGKYYITPSLIKKIEVEIIKKPKVVKISDNLFPKDLFNNTRNYVQQVAEQAIVSYDYGLYDACNVMLRRLIETLIIETFERKMLSVSIKDSNDNFFYLKELIEKLKTETSLNVSRNSKQGLDQLKSLGDMSAHNRRFIAKKTDIDKNKEILRILIQELLNIIDYPSWK